MSVQEGPFEPVRLAIVGAGIIGVQHARRAIKDATCRVVAVVDPVEAAAKALAEEVGAPSYPDVESMAANEDVEAVVVGVPNALHTPVGIACAERGLHMLMEKPIADSLEAGNRLLAAVERAGVRLATGHHRRFDPAAEAAHGIIRSGEIGRVLAVSVTWVQRKPDDYFDIAWHREPGAGPVLTNLIHDVDMLRYLCGEIDSVYAETGSEGRGFVIEDTAAVVLRFAGGAVGTVTVSDVLPSPWTWESATGENPRVPLCGEDVYRFFGTHAALSFPGIKIWRHDGASPGAWDLPFTREKKPLGERAALAAQLHHFCRVVRGLEEPRTGGADGLATLAATVAVHESVRRRQPVCPRELIEAAA